MSSQESKKHLFDDPRNVRLVVRALLVACVLLVGMDFVIHRHTEHPWEEMFAFYAVYGFVACVLLVLLAKEMRKLVMRDERYYGDEPAGPEDENQPQENRHD
jgi:membrane protein YdbS with pleckstrin-like domain